MCDRYACAMQTKESVAPSCLTPETEVINMLEQIGSKDNVAQFVADVKAKKAGNGMLTILRTPETTALLRRFLAGRCAADGFRPSSLQKLCPTAVLWRCLSFSRRHESDPPSIHQEPLARLLQMSRAKHECR